MALNAALKRRSTVPGGGEEKQVQASVIGIVVLTQSLKSMIYETLTARLKPCPFKADCRRFRLGLEVGELRILWAQAPSPGEGLIQSLYG